MNGETVCGKRQDNAIQCGPQEKKSASAEFWTALRRRHLFRLNFVLLHCAALTGSLGLGVFLGENLSFLILKHFKLSTLLCLDLYFSRQGPFFPSPRDMQQCARGYMKPHRTHRWRVDLTKKGAGSVGVVMGGSILNFFTLACLYHKANRQRLAFPFHLISGVFMKAWSFALFLTFQSK